MLALAAWLWGGLGLTEPDASAAAVIASPSRSAAAARSASASRESNDDPRIRLTLEAPSATGPWTIHVVNDGDVPVRLVADTRFLTFEVTPRSARRTILCVLPDPMLPADELERALVLLPRREFVESVEPRMYCLGTREFDALTSGSIVVARLGWAPKGGRRGGPWVVHPIDGVEPRISPRKALESPPIALPGEPTPPLATGATPTDLAEVSERPWLKLESAAAVDAPYPEDVEIPVVLRNEGSEPVTLRFRPESLGFDVVANGLAEHCEWPTVPTAPTRELFTKLPPKGRAELTLLLSSYCAGHALDQAGLLVVRAWLDTRHGSGDELGLRTFDGQVSATAPTFVRLERGRQPPATLRPSVREP